MSVLSSPYATQTTSGALPSAGLMVQPFPEPGNALRTAMEQLQWALINPPDTEEKFRALAALPRPWDPATCTGRMRAQLWQWLDSVAIWINEQHLWNVTSPGVPSCWPAHPHLVHDLATVASARYLAGFAFAPAPLDEWHRYCLPAFLDRLAERLGDGCQPGKHTTRARHERDLVHTEHRSARARAERFKSDVERADATVTKFGQ